MRSRGWVYVLSHPTISGAVKIGFTGRDPLLRCDEIGPGFQIEYHALVWDPFEIEQAVHARFRPYRVSEELREFFLVTVEMAARAIRDANEYRFQSVLWEGYEHPSPNETVRCKWCEYRMPNGHDYLACPNCRQSLM